MLSEERRHFSASTFISYKLPCFVLFSRLEKKDVDIFGSFLSAWAGTNWLWMRTSFIPRDTNYIWPFLTKWPLSDHSFRGLVCLGPLLRLAVVFLPQTVFVLSICLLMVAFSRPPKVFGVEGRHRSGWRPS